MRHRKKLYLSEKERLCGFRRGGVGLLEVATKGIGRGWEERARVLRQLNWGNKANGKGSREFSPVGRGKEPLTWRKI